MQGLLLNHVGLEWITFDPNNFHVGFKIRFPYWFRHEIEYHENYVTNYKEKCLRT